MYFSTDSQIKVSFCFQIIRANFPTITMTEKQGRI